jgi:hypothetical protein
MRGKCGERETHLHAEIGVCHATIDSQLGEFMTAVFLHRIEDGFGLEAGGLECGASHVTSLSVCCDANCFIVSSRHEIKICGEAYKEFLSRRRSNMARTNH